MRSGDGDMKVASRNLTWRHWYRWRWELHRPLRYPLGAHEGGSRSPVRRPCDLKVLEFLVGIDRKPRWTGHLQAPSGAPRQFIRKTIPVANIQVLCLRRIFHSMDPTRGACLIDCGHRFPSRSNVGIILTRPVGSFPLEATIWASAQRHPKGEALWGRVTR